jgi:hypothetical protein
MAGTPGSSGWLPDGCAAWAVSSSVFMEICSAMTELDSLEAGCRYGLDFRVLDKEGKNEIVLYIQP